MRKFKYKMETLLKLKENLEKQLKIEFINIKNYLTEEKEKLNKLNQRYYKYESLLIKSLKNELNITDINSHKNSLVFINKKINEQKELINELEEDLEKIIKNLIQIIKEKKVLEKLKDKEYEKYKIELRKEEDKEIDDFISFKYRNSIDKQ